MKQPLHLDKTNQSTFLVNLFIYQARGVEPGPSRLSDCLVSAKKNKIDEAFVLMGELR